ncbi:MAG: phosphatase [Oscillospiraceae bacterium]|nr:phosphatase [Oscillospiraceae bacterium]
MNIRLDTHCHTLASEHAYSTILENARAAADRGLDLLAITDHASQMPDASGDAYFANFGVLDKVLYGVEMLYGAEIDIVDFNGNVSMSPALRSRMGLCIASFHRIILATGSRAENTRAYLQAMQHEGVSIIGHPDDGNIPVDYEALAREAKQTGVLLEVNHSSFKYGYRKDAVENAKLMLAFCEQYGTSISIGSDAHFAPAVGEMGLAVAVLEEVRFPQELVVNLDVDRFQAMIAKRR